jgi:hypothetical protein
VWNRYGVICEVLSTTPWQNLTRSMGVMGQVAGYRRPRNRNTLLPDELGDTARVLPVRSNAVMNERNKRAREQA